MDWKNKRISSGSEQTGIIKFWEVEEIESLWCNYKLNTENEWTCCKFIYKESFTGH